MQYIKATTATLDSLQLQKDNCSKEGHCLAASGICHTYVLLGACRAVLRRQVVRVEPAPEQQQPRSSPGFVLLPEPEAIPDAPDWAKPNRSWVQQFVADFQQLRLQVQQAYEQQGASRRADRAMAREKLQTACWHTLSCAVSAVCRPVLAICTGNGVVPLEHPIAVSVFPPHWLKCSPISIHTPSWCGWVLLPAVYPTDRVPHMNDVEAWDRVCFGRPADDDLQLPAPLTDDSAEMTQLSPNICSKIMALEQVCGWGVGGLSALLGS